MLLYRNISGNPTFIWDIFSKVLVYELALEMLGQKERETEKNTDVRSRTAFKSTTQQGSSKL